MARTKLNTRQLGLIANENLDNDLTDIGNLTTLGILIRVNSEEIIASYDLNVSSLTINEKNVATEEYVANRILSFSGDVSGSGTNNITLTLPAVGTAGSYSKITTDTKGRVIAGRNLTNAEIITYLGYTPADKNNTQLTGTLVIEEGSGKISLSSDIMNFGIPLRPIIGTPTINFYASGNALPDATLSISSGTLNLSANRFTFNGDDVWFCYDGDIYSSNTTVFSTTPVVLDSYIASDYHAVEYFVAIINNTVVHSTKLLVANNGITATLSEYGTLFFDEPFGTLDVDLLNGSVRLLFTSTIMATLVIKTIRIGIKT